MSSIVFPSKFSSKNITITAPKSLPSGAKQAYANYANERFIMQTAVAMSVPFGLNVADKFVVISRVLQEIFSWLDKSEFI